MKFPIKQKTDWTFTNVIVIGKQQQQQQQQQPPQRQRQRQSARDHLDLLARILEVVMRQNIDGIIVSRIRYKLQLSTRCLKKYLDKLCCNGLIEIIIVAAAAAAVVRRKKKKRRLVRLTEKGTRFLHLYQRIRDMMLLH